MGQFTLAGSGIEIHFLWLVDAHFLAKTRKLIGLGSNSMTSNPFWIAAKKSEPHWAQLTEQPKKDFAPAAFSWSKGCDLYLLPHPASMDFLQKRVDHEWLFQRYFFLMSCMTKAPICYMMLEILYTNMKPEDKTAINALEIQLFFLVHLFLSVEVNISEIP